MMTSEMNLDVYQAGEYHADKNSKDGTTGRSRECFRTEPRIYDTAEEGSGVNALSPPFDLPQPSFLKSAKRQTIPMGSQEKTPPRSQKQYKIRIDEEWDDTLKYPFSLELSAAEFEKKCKHLLGIDDWAGLKSSRLPAYSPVDYRARAADHALIGRRRTPRTSGEASISSSHSKSRPTPWLNIYQVLTESELVENCLETSTPDNKASLVSGTAPVGTKSDPMILEDNTDEGQQNGKAEAEETDEEEKAWRRLILGDLEEEKV